MRWPVPLFVGGVSLGGFSSQRPVIWANAQPDIDEKLKVVNVNLFIAVKVSRQTESRLRFALKGGLPGQIAWLCDRAGLTLLQLKRLRIGRIPLASLPEGQWRYLATHERF